MNEFVLREIKEFKAGSIPGLRKAFNSLVAPINALIRAVQKLNAARTSTTSFIAIVIDQGRPREAKLNGELGDYL
jgi:hypothetical protein